MKEKNSIFLEIFLVIVIACKMLHLQHEPLVTPQWALGIA